MTDQNHALLVFALCTALACGTPADEIGSQPAHHSPFFRVEPEPSVRAGVEATVRFAMALMPR